MRKFQKGIALIISLLTILTPAQSFATTTQQQQPVNASQAVSDITKSKADVTLTPDETIASKAVEQATSTKAPTDIQKAIDLVDKLPQSDTKRNLVSNLATLANGLQDETIKDQLLTNILTDAVKTAEQTLDPSDYFVAYNILTTTSLPKNDTRTDLATRLDALKSKVQVKGQEQGYDWNNENPADFNAPSYTPQTEPIQPTQTTTTQSSTPSNFATGSSEDTYFEKDGQFYKKTTQYDENGKVVSTSTTLATPDEKAYYEWQTGGTNYGNYNWYQEGNKTFYSGAGTPYANSNPYGEYTSTTAQQQEPTESQITLQYTLDKQVESPTYIDTGLRIGLDNTVTYEQAKSAVEQLSVKSGGKYVEDVDRVLGLMDGQILILHDNKQKINVNDLENMFEGFPNVEVRALNTEIGGQYCLADYLQIKKMLNMKVNNKPVTLVAKPLIVDSRVLLPVQQIAQSLGATVSSDNTQVVVKENGNSIVYTVGKSTATVNGRVVNLDVPTKVNSQGIIMAQVQPMIDKLNATMVWDTDQNVLLINYK